MSHLCGDFKEMSAGKIGVYCNLSNTAGSNSLVGETDDIYQVYEMIWKVYSKGTEFREGGPSGLGMKEGILTGCWTWSQGHEHVRCGEQEEQHHCSKGVVWAESSTSSSLHSA